jgi:hypothetical protein
MLILILSKIAVIELNLKKILKDVLSIKFLIKHLLNEKNYNYVINSANLKFHNLLNKYGKFTFTLFKMNKFYFKVQIFEKNTDYFNSIFSLWLLYKMNIFSKK